MPSSPLVECKRLHTTCKWQLQFIICVLWKWLLWGKQHALQVLRAIPPETEDLDLHFKDSILQCSCAMYASYTVCVVCTKDSLVTKTFRSLSLPVWDKNSSHCNPNAFIQALQNKELHNWEMHPVRGSFWKDETAIRVWEPEQLTETWPRGKGGSNGLSEFPPSWFCHWLTSSSNKATISKPH